MKMSPRILAAIVASILAVGCTDTPSVSQNEKLQQERNEHRRLQAERVRMMQVYDQNEKARQKHMQKVLKEADDRHEAFRKSIEDHRVSPR